MKGLVVGELDIPSGGRLVPEHMRRLSGSALKVIATLTMFVDHTATVLPYSLSQIVLFSFFGKAVTLYYVMRAIGRVAFPIFCFLLVEGSLHTRSKRAYALRLAVFALLSEVPWNLLHCNSPFMPSSQSVFVTLLLCFVGLCMLQRLERAADVRELLRWTAGIVAVYVGLTIAHCDYGSKALGCVLAIYVLRAHVVPRAIVASSCLGNPLYVCMAFVPIAFYNGERGFVRGRAWQLFFYCVYPAHMLLLWWVRSQTIGW